MAFTQADIDNLDKAIATGTKKIKYGDKETEFQTIDDMLRLRDRMLLEVNGSPSINERMTMGVFNSTLNN